MRNKQGFSPVTIVIGLAIGSMVSLIVMNSISQLSGTLSRSTTLTQADMTVVLGLNVLEQDFSSLCMPEYIHYQEKEDKKSEKTEGKKEEDGKVVAPEKEQKKKKEYFKKAFVLKQSDKNLEKCTCISMYSINKDHIVPKKVIYTLEQDQHASEKVYTLYRRECGDLLAEKEDENKEHKFIVMRNIISLTCTLWARHLPIEQEKKEEKDGGASLDKKSKNEEKKKEPYRSFTEWSSDKNLQEQKETKDKKNTRLLPLLPDFIDVDIVIQQEKGREITYSTTIMTPWGFPELTVTGIAPIKHDQPEKENQNAQQQLESLSKNTELTTTLTDKVSNLANTMTVGQKEKR